MNDTKEVDAQLHVVATMVQLKRRIGRNSIIAFALLFNTFSWYFFGRTIVTQISSSFAESSIDHLLLMLAYPASIIASSIIGSIFLARAKKTGLFYGWLLLGVFTAAFLAVPTASPLIAAFLIVLLGISVGFGTPACLNYFTESIAIENRGKAGGITLLVTMLGASFLFIAISPLDLPLSSTFFLMWRAWCLPFTFFLSENKIPAEESRTKKLSFSLVLHNRTFLLYFAAWLMFALVDSFETAILNLRIGQFEFLIRIEPIIASFSALIAGVLSDWIGRRRILIFGFVSLGIAYAVIGLLPEVGVSWLLYYVIDGIALGSFSVLFMLVLWGDMSKNNSEKFYAIGETPLFLTEMSYILLTPYLGSAETSIFSLAAFFLFLAVLPLLYAPETLPEKKIKERELKIYIDRAKKVKQKYA